MNFSVSSGRYGIIQRSTFLCFGDSLDHTTDYTLADMTASANIWTQKIAIWTWQASATWEYEDTNYATLPFAVTDLVAGQSDYTLPTTVLAIDRVELIDDDGDYVRLKQIDLSEVGGSWEEFESTNGLPRYYDIRGNSLILKPAPSATDITTTNGLKVWLTRESNTFTVPATYTTADTTQPGFDEPYHETVAKGMAYDWLTANEKSKATIIRQEIEADHQLIRSTTEMKNRDYKVAIKPRIERIE